MPRRSDKVRTSFWYAEDLGSAELLRGRFADYAYNLHVHETACFALITRGAIRIRLRGTEFIARRGDLFAIDADEPHAGWAVGDEGWSLRTLYVSVDQLKAFIGDDRAPAGSAAIAGPILGDPKLIRLFHGIHHCSEVNGPALKREQRYLDFIARLFERHTRGTLAMKSPGREDRAVRLARDFLDDRLDEPVRLAAIAAAASLPRFRLLRAFERAIGMSPHAYQRQARLRRAAAMIRQGHKLSEAAATAGFADQAHLTRCFRRALGVTPGAYKAAFQAG